MSASLMCVTILIHVQISFGKSKTLQQNLKSVQRDHEPLTPFLSINPASFHGTPVSYLARSCLLQIESSALTMVLAWVKCMCWNWLFLRQTSTAFFLRSSRGTFDSAPMSFNSISAVTFTPRASINTHSI